MASRHYAHVLFMCLLVFRMGAQLAQVWHPVNFLPRYAAWQSDAVSYGLLLGVPGVILAASQRIFWRFFKGTIASSTQKGEILIALGIIYLVVRCVRSIVGLRIAPDHDWFMPGFRPSFIWYWLHL